jgi:uncharacterized surface protein with fasciclin (FAS1) repeats
MIGRFGGYASLVLGFIATVMCFPTMVEAAGHTEPYAEKQGFHRDQKDILNTLRNNEVTQFQNALDALQQGFDLDKSLKDGGPYTFFAASDKAFKKLSTEDYTSLFADKKRLRQIMSYSIVAGKVPAATLKTVKSLKTIDGRELSVSDKGGDLYVNGVLITTSDVPCTNGVIHVVDKVIMPPVQ